MTIVESVAANVEIDRAAVLRSLGLDLRDANTQAAIAVCQRYDLDPVLKHVVVVEGNVFITRDGLLHVAHTSGVLDGITLDDLTDHGDEWEARVSVFRKDMSHPFTFPGRYPKMQQTRNGPKPHKYAQEMAIKCAESHALRRAFSISGMGIADEIHSGNIIEAAAAAPVDARTEEELERDRLLSQLAELKGKLEPQELASWAGWTEKMGEWWKSPETISQGITYATGLLAAAGAEPFATDTPSGSESADVATQEEAPAGAASEPLPNTGENGTAGTTVPDDAVRETKLALPPDEGERLSSPAAPPAAGERNRIAEARQKATR